MKKTPSLIDLRHVSVMRGGRAVLQDLNLQIDAGEHVAILGPNGCGKSTLIKTITRELCPLAAENSSMRIFGQEQWNVFELRTLLGIVANDMAALATRPSTVREAILSGFFSSVGLWPHQRVTREMRVKSDELLALLEISHLAGRHVAHLSSGELQRVLIARALVHAPRALLFDEPSHSLDVFAQAELRRVLRKLARSGIAILLVTHQLADIIPEIERVIFMREGRIIADGPKKKLITAECLSSLFGVRVEISQRDGFYALW
jgi:iron complex transport system ATP-binding protein